MSTRKVYIIFTFALTTIGGGELYTAGKANYMKNHGWTVYCCTGEVNRTGKAMIPSLNEYLDKGCGWTFLWKPPYKFKRFEQEQILNFMIQRLELQDFVNCEIIIETHFSSVAFWGELLAERIKGQHFFVACEEGYRYKGICYYEENLDFFQFKWKRNELIYSTHTMFVNLFNGYKNITDTLIKMYPTVREQDAIQDIDFPQIDQIPRLDWNICHIGRSAKSYLPYVIEGVGEFARRHPDKRINFIFVGNINQRMDLIKQTFSSLSNVNLTLLGDMAPIPRILFSKIDVVCAISGSAEFCANEGILTIVANADQPDKTPGVLGYDTIKTVHGEPKYTYVEALENVLVKRIYDHQTYKLPKMLPAEHYYDNFWYIVENAAKTKEYYTERISKERIRDWIALFPFGSIARGARIILFGMTDITRDYLKQIESQSTAENEIGRDYIKRFTTPPIMN